MSRETTHTVRDVRASRGELSFDVDVCDIQRTLWFKTDAPVTPNADAVLATCLLPSMLWGGTLEIDAPISPRLLRCQPEFQAIQRMWSGAWDYGLLPLGEIDVIAPARASEPAAPGRSVATFFSGGVDSWSVAAEYPEVTHLVFVRGLDLVERPTAFVDDVERRLREAAADLGKTLYVVDTNLRELSNPLLPWNVYFSSPLYAVALLLAPLFGRFLVTGDTDYATNAGLGVDPLGDHLWSTEELEVAHACGRLSRVERTVLIADDPVAQRALRVCWENLDGAYNCGRCRKCLSTMITLEALDKRKPFSVFPAQLDLEPLADIAVPDLLVLTLWQDILDLIRDRDRVDLEPAVAAVVARGKRGLGLPDSFRVRDTADGRLSGAERQALRGQLETVLGSRSWRVTAPLRGLGTLLRRH